MVDWIVGWSIGWFVIPSVVGGLIGALVGLSNGWLPDQMAGRLLPEFNSNVSHFQSHLPPPPLEMATPENKSIHSTLSCICQQVRLTSGRSRMQVTLHATRRISHGASRLVLAMSAWSVKIPTYFVLGVVGERGSRVIHTTTAMHGIECTPPFPTQERFPQQKILHQLIRVQMF